jgi:hypothetical protein
MARAARDQRGLGPAAQLIAFSNPGAGHSTGSSVAAIPLY